MGTRPNAALLLAANLLATMVPMIVLIAGGLNYMAGWYHREVLAMRCDALVARRSHSACGCR